jgi:hypothetical protein
MLRTGWLNRVQRGTGPRKFLTGPVLERAAGKNSALALKLCTTVEAG